ncbi:MAG: TlyA family RNA methyltransferase [Verrucomicrobia bacterium]|nr:TlyA family RNA methyltransferase [Verrucomicrobiota bacterium]
MGNRKPAGKERLDLLMVSRGLAETREQAQRLIMAAQVLVDGHASPKAGHRIRSDAEIQVKTPPRFVSRGGDKLEAAFEAFDLSVNGLTCLDVGSSTGGFTDCMLQHGAAHVIALDVGTAQLHWKLRQDARVTVIEQYNARHLKPEDLPAKPEFASFDVSFISLTLVLPPVIQALSPSSELLTLIKPQFEAGRDQVEKGGVVRDPAIRQEVVKRIKYFGVEEQGLEWLGLRESPVLGPAGNVEFLAWWRKPEDVPRATA